MRIDFPNAGSVALPERQNRRMVLLKVNTVCNLRCTYCWYVIKPELRVPVHEEMSTNRMLEMLDCLALRLGDLVYLSGGEAVLRRDIVEVCRYIQRTGATAYLTTAGLMLDRLLALSKIVDGYIISLESADSVVHNQLRGRHTKVLTNIAKLASIKPVCVTVVLSRKNVAGLADLAKLCISLGVESFFVQLLKWYPAGPHKADQICLGRRDLPMFRDMMEELRRLSSRIRIPNDAYLRALEELVRWGEAGVVVHDCFAIKGYLTTSPRGSIDRCPHVPSKGPRSSKADTGKSGSEAGDPSSSCEYFSEHCSDLVGHFSSDLFNDIK